MIHAVALLLFAAKMSDEPCPVRAAPNPRER
jgi:hypothetical protein